MNKKGEWTADTAPFMAIFIIVCGGLFMVFIFIIHANSNQLYQIPPKTEEITLKERFLASCFVEEDLLSGVSSSMINWNKFDQTHLDKCYDISSGSKNYAFKLNLEVEDTTRTIQTRNWKGDVVSGESQMVTVFYNGERKTGKLLIEVQNAK